MAYPTLAERLAGVSTIKYDPMAKYAKYYTQPVGIRKVGDTKFMHNTTYEWTGSYWKCLDPSKRTFMQVRNIKGIAAKKKALEEQLDLKPGSGMSYRALTQALAAGGIEQWHKALAEKAPIPRVTAPTITPDVTVAEGDFEVVAGQGIRDKATGKIIGYIGADNQLMDLHGTVIGSYVGDRKTVTKVSLATFKAVPEREGIPYCEEKNYEKAKEYLVKLMDAGEVPGGSTLVQRHGEWVYIPPKPENETMKLDTGEWIYKQSYDQLAANDQDYLKKYGIKAYIGEVTREPSTDKIVGYAGYLPVQQWLAEATIKKVVAQLAPYGTTYETAKKAYEAGIITLKQFAAYTSARLFPTAEAEAREVYTPITTYDLAAAREGGVPDSTLLVAGFTEKDLEDTKKWQAKITSGEIIALPDGTYITKEGFDKQSKGCQQILKAEGFGGYFAAVDYYNTVEEAKNIAEATAVAKWLKENPYPGFLKSGGMTEKEWTSPASVKMTLVIIEARDEVFQKLLAKMSAKEKDLYYQGGEAHIRGIFLAPLIMVFPPTKALKTEYTIGDVSKVEWALGAVNVALIATVFAPGALLGSIAGRGVVTGISTTGAGLVGYTTAKNWSDMSGVHRGLGVGAVLLYSLPLLGSVARGIRITSGKIPTVAGDVTTWKGLMIARNPVIGRSGGKFVIGARNITIPEARLILNGYHPGSVLETKVFVNTKALKAAGFSETQINYLKLTLKSRNLFAGKKSPFLSKEVLIEPTARLDADEIQVLLKQISKYNKQIQQVDLLYGSPTIKAQLTPELRAWRQIHDWDIRTIMSQVKTEAFARELLKALRKLPGKRQYRINPDNPLLVEKKIGGSWKHIADIHSAEMKPDVSEIPGSKLDTTGEYSYGRLVAEPAITVKYPGHSSLSIMRLSESGVRKADTILRVRHIVDKTGKTTAFRPPQRGIAQPGVPKDAADFYVVLHTLKGQKIADTWAASWAKAMGYTPDEVTRLLSKITKSMREVAIQTPSDLIGYRIIPSKTVKVSPGASPTITIHIPSSLGASVSASLKKSISAPISPYTVSSSALASLSPSFIKSSFGVSPKIVSPSPASSPSIKVSPSISPSPSPSGVVSPSPGVKPSPYPYPSPIPVPTPVPSPVPIGKKLLIMPPATKLSKLTKKQREGIIAWKQGWVYKLIYPPYGVKDIINSRKPLSDVKYHSGVGSAYKSVIAKGGKVPPEVLRDMGIMDLRFKSDRPTTKKPKLFYKRDIKQRTTTTPGITRMR